MEKLLTDEGKKMWELIGTYKSAMNPPPPPEDNSPLPFDFWQSRYEALVIEIMQLKRNSEMVVRDCNKMLKKVDTVEEYLQSDFKVAKTVHENCIKRYNRLLSGLTAFEKPIDLKGIILLD